MAKGASRMGERHRILVVDDNPATRYSVARVLKAAGFEAIQGSNGFEALAYADSTVDLVVLDVNLPDIHGFEVCRQLRARPETALIPVLHVSATFKNEEDKALGLASGADGYLTHPVEPLVLV